MDIGAFAALTENKGRRPSERTIRDFEKEIGEPLPSDYREFLYQCNGGYVGGTIWFAERDGTKTVGVHHVGGFRRTRRYSLRAYRKLYQLDSHRIPRDLLWVMDDPFGNATCIGIRGPYRGMVFFWDHETSPGDNWNGSVDAARNVSLITTSFSGFIDGCVQDID